MSDGHSSPLLLVRPFSRPLVLLPAYSVCIGRYSCTLLSRPSTSSFSHEGGGGDFFPLTDGRAFKDGQTGMKASEEEKNGRSVTHSRTTAIHHGREEKDIMEGQEGVRRGKDKDCTDSHPGGGGTSISRAAVSLWWRLCHLEVGLRSPRGC